jgi:hypothetical protein
MTDAELRALVRDAVARRLGTERRVADPVPPAAPVRASEWSGHPSHHLYLQVVNTTDACVIEPSVTCDHCGYCKSHGH